MDEFELVLVEDVTVVDVLVLDELVDVLVEVVLYVLLLVEVVEVTVAMIAVQRLRQALVAQSGTSSRKVMSKSQHFAHTHPVEAVSTRETASHPVFPTRMFVVQSQLLSPPVTNAHMSDEFLP